MAIQSESPEQMDALRAEGGEPSQPVPPEEPVTPPKETPEAPPVEYPEPPGEIPPETPQEWPQPPGELPPATPPEALHGTMTAISSYMLGPVWRDISNQART